jgi:hypothetical protein
VPHKTPGFLTYCLLARPAERRIHSHAVEAPAAIEGAAVISEKL